jgi:hypothetical protein
MESVGETFQNLKIAEAASRKAYYEKRQQEIEKEVEDAPMEETVEVERTETKSENKEELKEPSSSNSTAAVKSEASEEIPAWLNKLLISAPKVVESLPKISKFTNRFMNFEIPKISVKPETVQSGCVSVRLCAALFMRWKKSAAVFAWFLFQLLVFISFPTVWSICLLLPIHGILVTLSVLHYVLLHFKERIASKLQHYSEQIGKLEDKLYHLFIPITYSPQMCAFSAFLRTGGLMFTDFMCASKETSQKYVKLYFESFPQLTKWHKLYCSSGAKKVLENAQIYAGNALKGWMVLLFAMFNFAKCLNPSSHNLKLAGEKIALYKNPMDVLPFKESNLLLLSRIDEADIRPSDFFPWLLHMGTMNLLLLKSGGVASNSPTLWILQALSVLVLDFCPQFAFEYVVGVQCFASLSFMFGISIQTFVAVTAITVGYCVWMKTRSKNVNVVIDWNSALLSYANYTIPYCVIGFIGTALWSTATLETAGSLIILHLILCSAWFVITALGTLLRVPILPICKESMKMKFVMLFGVLFLTIQHPLSAIIHMVLSIYKIPDWMSVAALTITKAKGTASTPTIAPPEEKSKKKKSQ